jgi:glutamate dehydrogenase
MVNRMGATFVMRMGEDTGKTPAQVARAFNIAREALDARDMWAEIEALDGKVDGNTQIDALLVIWATLRGMTRWLLNHAGATLNIADEVSRYHEGMRILRRCVVDAITPRERARDTDGNAGSTPDSRLRSAPKTRRVADAGLRPGHHPYRPRTQAQG